MAFEFILYAVYFLLYQPFFTTYVIINSSKKLYRKFFANFELTELTGLCELSICFIDLFGYLQGTRYYFAYKCHPV